MSSRKKHNKFFTSLLIFILVFSLFAPSFVLANTTPQGKHLNVSKRAQVMESLVQKQEALLAKSPTLHPSLKNVKDDENVSVIVQLSEAPVALEKGKQTFKGKSFTSAKAASVKQKVVAQQAVFEKLKAGKSII